MKQIISIILIITLLICNVGCAIQDEPQTPTIDTDYTQGVTEDTINIGAISLTSGIWSFIGQPLYDGLQACFLRQNALGGIDNKQINLIAYDDQFDSAVGRMTIEKLVEEDKVFLLTSLYSNIIESSFDYLQQKQIPVVGIISGADICFSDYNENSRIFQVQPANFINATYLIARVLHEPLFGINKNEKLPQGSKIAVIHGIDATSLITIEYIKDYAKECGRLTDLVFEGVNQETYGIAIQKLMAQNCKACIYIGSDSTTWMAAMNDAQWEIPVIFSYEASSVTSFVPETYNINRPIYANIWSSFDTDDSKNMIDDMADALSYIPDLDKQTIEDYKGNSYCIAGYLYGMTVLAGLNRIAQSSNLDFTWEDFVKAMEQEPIDLGSVTLNYVNHSRLGVNTMGLVEYIINDKNEEELVMICPFETLDSIKNEGY